MAEIERTRTRERGARTLTGSQLSAQKINAFVDRQLHGQIVIKKSDREVQNTHQGIMRYYLDPQQHQTTPLQDWRVWTNDIKKHSGKHRHQGGLVIYVIEGRGYSIVDDERVEWETGDLMLLPIRPKGVTHQHFNYEPGKPCLWMAFMNWPVMEHVGTEMVQIENQPDYKG
jgi:mannose-6-phosphate isomerase-like protein (cupin superfamily)